MVNCAPQPTLQGNHIEKCILCRQRHTDHFLIHRSYWKKNQITEDVMQHFPFPLRRSEKSNLKFRSVRFYQLLKFEVRFSQQAQFFVNFFLPSGMVVGILPSFSSP